VSIFRILEALAIFPIIFILTGGGPASATEPINFYAYITGFDYLKIDYAAAIIVFFFILLMIISLPLMKGMAKRVYV
jgi:multiple sugar transport system permease protein